MRNTMRCVLHGLLQVWLLDIARLLDEPKAKLGDQLRLSVRLILQKINDESLTIFYKNKMAKADMKKFAASNRQLRNEKISHRTPGSLVRTQKAGVENYFEILKEIIHKIKKNPEYNITTDVNYKLFEKQAKKEAAEFMHNFT